MNFLIKAFSSKNGDPSSKRILGAIIIFCTLYMGVIELQHKRRMSLLGKEYNVEETWLLGALGIGSGMIVSGLAEKKYGDNSDIN